ncbi:unnamed protein product [Ectocarpus sp. CCAP 1310/34]|nr:unnamed protein product [Ectocarpus sp. CCAP 1310/34]
MWHGHPPPPGATYPFLKPAANKVKRTDKSEPKAQQCFYLGPGININRDCVRILNEKRQAITTRNFTWQPVPAAPTAVSQSLPPITEEDEEFTTEEDEVGGGASRQGEGRAEGEPGDGGPGFNIGTTAAPGPAGPPARVAPAAPPAAPQESGAGDAGDSAPWRREGASVAPSTTSEGMADVGGGEDDRRSSSSRGSGGSGSGSCSGSGSDSDGETDLPALRRPEARRLAHLDKPAELTSCGTRKNPRRNPSMMWVLTFSRPNVSFAVRTVARPAHAPAKRHWDAIQKILGNLKKTRDLGIIYQRGSGLRLAVYVNASYADTEDKRSVSGLATTVGGTVVSHGSKTQSIVSLSSMEAEYIAAGRASRRHCLCVLCFCLLPRRPVVTASRARLPDHRRKLMNLPE